MKKKFLSLLLALAMCLSLSVPAWAAVIENDPIIEPNGPQYHYKTEYLPRQDKVYLTKPDNQDPEGTYFTRGLSIHFTINNGTTLDKTAYIRTHTNPPRFLWTARSNDDRFCRYILPYQRYTRP